MATLPAASGVVKAFAPQALGIASVMNKAAMGGSLAATAHALTANRERHERLLRNIGRPSTAMTMAIKPAWPGLTKAFAPQALGITAALSKSAMGDSFAVAARALRADQERHQRLVREILSPNMAMTTLPAVSGVVKAFAPQALGITAALSNSVTGSLGTDLASVRLVDCMPIDRAGAQGSGKVAG